MDEPPLTPRPRKSLFSSEREPSAGHTIAFHSSCTPCKVRGNSPPTRTRLAEGPPIMSPHQPSPEREGGQRTRPRVLGRSTAAGSGAVLGAGARRAGDGGAAAYSLN